jgi:hypothetical protein
MEDQERKARFIIISALICALLILIELLLLHFHLGPTALNLLVWLAEFILAVSGLIAVRGWRARRWIRLCAIGIMLGVICWTLFWPIAAVLSLPAVIST